MTTVLVTGGGGYIGNVLCEKLLEQGYKVICCDRFFFGLEPISRLQSHPKFSILKTDTRFLKGADFQQVTAVFDLAGLSNDPACDLDEGLTRDINYNGSLNVVKCAKDAGVKRYIYISSCSVYGFNKYSQSTEESSLNPVSLYARLKLEYEQALEPFNDNGFCITRLRLGTVYGLSARMRFDLVINIMTMYAVTKGKVMILGGGKQWRPLVHVRDVVQACLLTLKASKSKVAGEIFNVGCNEQNFQVRTIANLVKDITGCSLEVVPDDPDKRNYNVNFDKISKVLGFKTFYSPEDSIKLIAKAIKMGQLDPEDDNTRTVKYYQYLIDAHALLKDIMIDGRLF